MRVQRRGPLTSAAFARDGSRADILSRATQMKLLAWTPPPPPDNEDHHDHHSLAAKNRALMERVSALETSVSESFAERAASGSATRADVNRIAGRLDELFELLRPKRDSASSYSHVTRKATA